MGPINMVLSSIGVTPLPTPTKVDEEHTGPNEDDGGSGVKDLVIGTLSLLFILSRACKSNLI